MIIQTTNPQHPLFSFVLHQQTIGFFEEQLIDRKNHDYPPYSRLVEITIKHVDKKICREAADELVRNYKVALNGVKIMGPGEPMVSKIRNEYLMNILIKIPRALSGLHELKHQALAISDKLLMDKKFRSVRVQIDVDPV